MTTVTIPAHETPDTADLDVFGDTRQRKATGWFRNGIDMTSVSTTENPKVEISHGRACWAWMKGRMAMRSSISADEQDGEWGEDEPESHRQAPLVHRDEDAHRHQHHELSVGEVQHARRPVQDDEGEREQSRDGTSGEPGDDDVVQEVLHAASSSRSWTGAPAGRCHITVDCPHFSKQRPTRCAPRLAAIRSSDG